MLPARLTLTAALLVLLGPCSAAAKDTWIEVRSPHFTVVSNAGEGQARHTAGQFERIRLVFRKTISIAAKQADQSILILAVKNEDSMRELLPEYWEEKKHAHPAGIFTSALHYHVVILHVDTSDVLAYEPLYHEYYHSVTLPYYPGLPVWIAEGLAEYYGNTELRNDEAILGEPSMLLLYTLHHEDMISLDTLFRVTHTSPYYNESSKTSIFYAESWVLIHYLLIGDNQIHRDKLRQYLDLIGQGVPIQQVETQVFGDLKVLQKALAEYISRPELYHLPIKLESKVDEKEYSVRALSAAEVQADEGFAFAVRFLPDRARPLLEGALKLDPSVARAYEGLALLAFEHGDVQEADRQLGEAIRLDPDNFMTRYLRGSIASRAAPGEEVGEQAEADLRKTIDLNPEFAPAYSALAMFLARHRNDPQTALPLASQAVALEPGSVQARLALGWVYFQAHQWDDAIAAARAAQALSVTEEEHHEALTFFNLVERMQDAASASKPPELAPPPADDATAPPEDLGTESTESRTAEGLVADVACDTYRMRVVLQTSAGSLQFHTGNYTKLEYLSLNWKPPDPFLPCSQLKGLHATVSYHPLTGGKFDGEIVSLTLRK